MKNTKKTNSLGDATFSDIKSPKHCKFVFQKKIYIYHLTRLVKKKRFILHKLYVIDPSDSKLIKITTLYLYHFKSNRSIKDPTSP